MVLARSWRRLSSSCPKVVAVGLAVTVPAVVLAAAPAGADTTGPAIVHDPVLTAPYGQAIPITARSNCTVGSVCTARLYYRTTLPAALAGVPGVVGEAGFTPVTMNGIATAVDTQQVITWTAEIPAGAVTTSGVDYYLEVDQNGTRTVFPGSATADTVQPVGTYVHVHVLNPPLIDHVPVPVAVADQPMKVDAQVACSSGNCTATLYYRKTPTTAATDNGWTPTGMSPQGAGTPIGNAAVLLLVQGTVPAASVDTMGVDYWIHVSDGHTQAYHPGTTYEGWYAPRDGTRPPFTHHHVHVLEPPHIVHAPVATAPYRQGITISAQANCPATRQCQATLYYRTPPAALGTAPFATTSMTVSRAVAGSEPVTLQGTIPAGSVDTRGVDYYFSLSDGTTTAWWPGTSAVDGPGVWVDGVRVAWQHIRVQEPPHFVHVPITTAPPKQDLVVRAELTCATEGCDPTLFYSTNALDTSNVFQAADMHRVEVRASTSASRVELWEGRIPAGDVTTRGLRYYLAATDGYTNTAWPGTFYWGAHAAVDGSNPAPAFVHHVVRVVDPPHPVHAPVGAAFTAEPIPIEARANCGTQNCTATLHFRTTGGAWQATGMNGVLLGIGAYGNELLNLTSQIPATTVTTTGVEYRIEVTDGYVAETTPTFPVVVTDRPSGLPSTTTTSLPPVTTTSVPVTTTSVPVTTTSTTLPPVTTTSVPVTTTSTSVPTTTTTLPPNDAPLAPTLISPSAGQALSTTDPQVFVINAVDPNGDAWTGTVSVTNQFGTTTTFPTTASASGTDATGAPTTPLGQGTYTWRARATDVNTTNGEWSSSRTFTVGNQAPIVPTLLSPAPGATLSDDQAQLFSIVASDAEGHPYTGTVTVRNIATNATTTFPTSLALSGQHSQGAPTTPLAPGDYVWKARATDALGLPGPETAERAFRVIVNQAPGIPTQIAPTPGKVLYQNDPQVFTVAADDPNGDIWHGIVRIYDSGGLVDEIRTLPAQSGGYASGVPTVALGPGDYTWHAAATDNPDPSAPPPTTWSMTRAFSVSSSSDVPPTALPSDRATTRASRNVLGEQGLHGMSEDSVVSSDGRFVAFESEADNLVPLDTNFNKDVFVHDRVTGLTERVSVSDTEAESSGGWVDSFDPSISADGRYVAFISAATNLVPGDTNGAEDVFVRDREEGTTVRVNVANGVGGAEANASALEADLSDDGRHVAFSTYATNLGTTDTNGVTDIYVRDIDSGVTQRVSTPFMTPSGEASGGTFGSRDPSISSGGRFVAFESDVETFEGGGNPDNNFTWDVFLRDRSASWGTIRVSTKAPWWEDTAGTSRNPEVSNFGDYVVFESTSTDMVSGDNDTNGTWDVFRYDESSSTIERVSFNSSGAQLNGPSFDAGVSGGGYVVFRSSATNAVANDRNGVDDVFLRDVERETTALLSHDADGHQANNVSMNPSVSADGMHVAFSSFATNLVTADTNRGMDVFAYNRRLSLTCAAGALSAVGCLSGYGFKASSDRLGLEDFYAYHAFDAGSDMALLNVSNGNLVVQGTDLNVPGQGLNMKLTHTYNSLKDQGGGPLGRGWRIGVADGESGDLLGAVVSAVLSADVGQLLEVVVTQDQFDFFDADGTRHHFIKGGLDGPGWHAPPGVNLTLTDSIVSGEQRYKATRPDGVSYEFRPLVGGGGYFVTRIADRNGNQLTFSYSSGRLSSITDTNGRSITFAWSGDYLSSASYGGVTVSYSVSGDRLQSISVAGRTTSYGYDSEGLRTITDARNNTTTFTLSGGMLTNVRDRESKDWTIAYNEATAECQAGDPGAAVATCITDPEGNSEVYTSSAEGNLLVHRDAGDTAPNQRSYFWEGNRIVSETGYGGHTNEYAYNENGQVVLKREFGAGDEPLTTALVYRTVAPGVADLVEANVGVDSSDLRTWRFTRSEAGNVTATTDPEGAITTFTYDSTGRLTSVTDPRSKTTGYGSYHASGQPQTITDPLGESRTYTYDDFGRVRTMTDRNGQTWGTVYDDRGNVTSKSSPNGTASFGYDLNDNQTTATPPGGATVTRVYDKRDMVKETSATVDGVLRRTTYDYNADGTLRFVRGPRESAGSPTASQTVEYVRYPNNRVQALVDEAGLRTDFTYTGEGLVRTVMEPPGTVGRHVTSYTYNRRGQITSETETNYPDPTTTTHVYGPHGELLSTRTPMGHTTAFAYDKVGRLARTIDPQGRQSTRTYDPGGNLVTLTQPEGNGGQLTTTYSYTARNQILTESDPADGGHVVEYQYDDEGRQTHRYDKRNGVVERTVTQTRRGDGAVLTRTATASGLPTHQASFGYDAAGNMTSASATVGGVTVSSFTQTYNGAFEPSTWTETVYDTAGNPRATSGAYSYQPDGLLSSRAVAGELTTYRHTANGRESEVDPWGAPGVFGSVYYDNGLLRTSTMPNGIVTEQLFDTGDRLKSRIVRRNDLLMTPVSTWTDIEYDNDDRRIQETVTQEQVPETTSLSLESGTGHYGYDSLGRLTSTTHPFEGRPTDYALDDGGNIVHDGDTAFTFTKNRLDRSAGTTTKNELGGGTTTAARRATFDYDQLGNQTKETATATVTSAVDDEVTETGTRDTVSTYAYDAASHPVQVHTAVNDTREGNTQSSVDYAYDALGRLVRRVEHPASGPNVVTLFFHDGTSDQLALETDGAGTVQVRYVLDSEGSPVAQDKAGSRSYYVDDPRGNLTQQLDGSQGVVAVYAYDPYGNEKSEHTKSKAPSWESRLRFQMAPRDPATGAYNLGPRLFDPGINRFVGADSYVGAAANMGLSLDPLTGNRYLYAGANPVGLIDDGHGWGWLKKQGAKLGKGILKNTFVRSLVVGAAAVAAVGFCGATAGLGCVLLAGAAGGVAAGAAWNVTRYVATSKTLTVGGAVNAAKKTVVSDAIEGATSALAATAEAARAAKHGLASERVAGALDNVGSAVSKAVHGNSRQSTKLTYLYRLETKEGEYLLTGITSNPRGRYSQAFMKGKTMRFLTQGDRSDMLDFERMIVEMDPGPLNREPWAGSAG